MNFGYGYEREFKTFFTQKIKRIDLKERIYSPQKLKFQNETSIQESNIVANFCATVFVLGTLKNFPKIKKSLCWDFFPVLERLIIFKKIPVLGIFPCAGEIGFFRVKIPVLETFFAPCSKKKTLK